ncbi:hypothetical protein H9P43_004393 [Blastocladiella emersonii ATCC 22665]|nr:hypothetical protein H9P43_004393 [Blastocladiella emersonii ATCC 22665]
MYFWSGSHKHNANRSVNGPDLLARQVSDVLNVYVEMAVAAGEPTPVLDRNLIAQVITCCCSPAAAHAPAGAPPHHLPERVCAAYRTYAQLCASDGVQELVPPALEVSLTDLDSLAQSYERDILAFGWRMGDKYATTFGKTLVSEEIVAEEETRLKNHLLVEWFYRSPMTAEAAAHSTDPLADALAAVQTKERPGQFIRSLRRRANKALQDPTAVNPLPAVLPPELRVPPAERYDRIAATRTRICAEAGINVRGLDWMERVVRLRRLRDDYVRRALAPPTLPLVRLVPELPLAEAALETPTKSRAKSKKKKSYIGSKQQGNR